MRGKSNKLLVIFGVVTAITLASVAVAYWMGLRVYWANEACYRSRQVVEVLEEILSIAKDVETNQRDYLLTGEEKYAAPYEGAVAHIDSHLKQLEEWAQSGELPGDQAAAVSGLTHTRLEEIRQISELRRRDGLAAALALARQDQPVMDKLRALITDLEARTEQEFDRRWRLRDQANLARTLVTAAMGVVTLAFLVWAYREVRRGIAATEEQRQLLAVTLASIGDAVIVTDVQGRVTFLNQEAEQLTGWTGDQAQGQALPSVFQIVNENTRQPVESPVAKVLREGTVVGLANHTILLTKDGREIPIDDSGAPIRQEDGAIQGVVLVFRDFTQRKAAEELLRESEAQLRLALDAGRMALWDWDIPTGNVKWNDEHYRMLGYEPGAFAPSYQHWITRVHPDDRAAAEAGIRKSMVEGGEYSNEFRTLWPDGTERWLEARGRFDYDGAGKAVRNYGVMLDITRRKRMEEELRAVSQRLAYHVDNSPLAVIEWGADMKLTRWSGEAERLFGWKAEEVLGKRMEDFRWIYQEDMPQVKEVSAELTTGRDPQRFSSNRNYRKDGSIVHCEWYNSALVDAAGKLVSILSLVLDVTDRKCAEEALRESEARFKAIASHTPDHILVQDRELRYLFVVNPQLGLTEGDMLGKTDYDFLSREDAEHLTRLKRQVLETGQPVQVEAPLLSPGGERQIFSGSYVPRYNAAGQIDGLIGYFQNITERKRAEEELQKLASVVRHSREFISIATLDGKMAFLNQAGAEMVGLTTGEVEQIHILQVVSDAHQDKVKNEVLPTLMSQGFWAGELQYRNLKSGRMIEVYATTFVIQDPETGTPLYLANTSLDITNRKRTEDVLKFLVECGTTPSGEDFFRALARYLGHNLGMDFVCIDRLEEGLLAATTLAVYFDGKFDDNVSYALKDTPCGDVVGKSICSFAKGVRHLFPKDQVLQDMKAESYLGTTLWSSQGRPIGLIAVIGRQPLADTALAASILQLVAVRAAGELERRRAEEALRQANVQLEQRVAERTQQLAAINADLREQMDAYHRLEGEVARLVEDERLHLGMELHDNLCQQIAATGMLAATLVKRLREQDSGLAQTADRIAATLSQAGADAHALARGLLPVQVEADGLMVALAGLAQRTQELQGAACVFECAAPVPVASNATATHLFRIAQEAIHNAIQHGKARHIVMTLTNQDGVTLTIYDDGVGIRPASRRAAGSGLRIMAYRARVIGAALSVAPAPTGGTLVRCAFTQGAIPS